MFVALYVAAVVLANLSVVAFGPWVSPINALLLIGLDLSLRDRLHERWRGRGLVWRMFLLVGAAGVLSYALNPASGRIALASTAAFVVSAALDALVYSGLIRRPWQVKANGSNVAGALADSILFPTLAFGAFLPGVIALQFAAKVIGGFLWSLALSHRTRAVA